MHWLDIFFANYQWYRQKVGGTWYFVTLRPVPGMGDWWTRRSPWSTETVLATEVYP